VFWSNDPTVRTAVGFFLKCVELLPSPGTLREWASSAPGLQVLDDPWRSAFGLQERGHGWSLRHQSGNFVMTVPHDGLCKIYVQRADEEELIAATACAFERLGFSLTLDEEQFQQSRHGMVRQRQSGVFWQYKPAGSYVLTTIRSQSAPYQAVISFGLPQGEFSIR